MQETDRPKNPAGASGTRCRRRDFFVFRFALTMKLNELWLVTTTRQMRALLVSGCEIHAFDVHVNRRGDPFLLRAFDQLLSTRSWCDAGWCWLAAVADRLHDEEH